MIHPSLPLSPCMIAALVAAAVSPCMVAAFAAPAPLTALSPSLVPVMIAAEAASKVFGFLALNSAGGLTLV